MSTLSSVEPLLNQSAYSRTVRELRSLIASGAIPRGESLPSERDLSERLGVARRTVRKALASLSDEGVVLRCGGKSRQVAPVASVDGDRSVIPWVSRAVVVLVPGEGTGASSPNRSRWLRFATLGSFDAVRSAGLHSVGLTISNLGSDVLNQLADTKPLGVLIPDVLPFLGPDQEREIFDGLEKIGVPVVLYGGAPALARFDRVCTDHEHGSYELTRYLISLGKKRVRPCWPKPWDQYWFVARLAGYERAMREVGLSPMEICELPHLTTAGTTTDFNSDDFRHESRLCAGYLTEALLGKHPADALMVGTDRELPFVSAGCRFLGKKPGQDVLLAGYDNYYDACEEQAFEPTIPVATIDKENEQAGEEMVRLLTDRTSGRLASGPQMRNVDQRLVVPCSFIN